LILDREILPNYRLEHDRRDSPRWLSEIRGEPDRSIGTLDVRGNSCSHFERATQRSETITLVRPDVGRDRETPFLRGGVHRVHVAALSDGDGARRVEWRGSFPQAGKAHGGGGIAKSEVGGLVAVVIEAEMQASAGPDLK